MFSRIARGVMPFIRAAPRSHPHTRLIPQTREFHVQARNVVNSILSTIIPTPIRSSIPANFSAVSRAARSPATLPFTARSKLILNSARPSFMPHGPTIPCSTMEVGLNPARQFSSSRPLFQNVVQNVPIALRAFSEADWEVQRKEMNRRKAIEIMKGKKIKISNPRPSRLTPKDSMKESFDHYFVAPTTPEVTTYLTIPLAPAEARTPLPVESSATLLDPAIASVHESYQRHSARVDSILRRLDAANAWDRGAVCEGYGTAATGEDTGLCSVLRIKFSGWTLEMVKEVIGEAGIGWCELEQVPLAPKTVVTTSTPSTSVVSDPLDEPLPLQPVSPISSRLDQALVDEATSSFIMPTLDFSSSFSTLRQDMSTTATPVTFDVLSGTATPISLSSYPSSPRSEVSDLTEFAHYYSDSDSSSSDESWSVALPPSMHHSAMSESRHGWVSFSSDFSSRVERDFYF